MSKTQSFDADISQWPPRIKKQTRQVLLKTLNESPTGEIYKLSQRIVEQVFSEFDDDEKDYVIGDLQPFELLECAGGVSAEDDSTAFMGPNWCAFSIFKLSPRDYLIVEDRLEEREYEVRGSETTIRKALAFMHEAIVDRLGKGRVITLSDGTTTQPSSYNFPMFEVHQLAGHTSCRL